MRSTMGLPHAGSKAASGQTSRWMAVGTSEGPDPMWAGAQAARGALTGADPQLLVVFCSPRLDPHGVIAGINAVSGGVPLIGCATGGEIAMDGHSLGRVVVTALGGPGFRVTTASATEPRTNPRELGSRVARAVPDSPDGSHQALLLLTDGLTPVHEAILSGVYDVLGASVPLIGGAACPDPAVLVPNEYRTFQMCGDEVLTRGVVAAAITSEAPLGIAVRHGFRKVGEPMIVTRSSEGRVFELDDQPALPAYLDRLGAPDEAYHDLSVFGAFARARPVGIRRRNGEEVRSVFRNSSFDTGSLGCSGEIPEGGVLWPMVGDAESILESTDEAWLAAATSLGDHRPMGFLAFDCGLRRDVLGDRVPDEVARMAAQATDLPFAGFYTAGEIARTRGINGFHHQSLAVLAVG